MWIEVRKLDEEREEEETGEAFQRSDKQRRRRGREREATEMDGKRRQGGNRHENDEIVSNNCEEEKLERMIRESAEEGGRDGGSNEGKEGRRGKEVEERVKVGESVGNNSGVESDNFFSLLLQWFFCWLAGYLGVAFPWILLVFLLHNRYSLLFS